MNSTLNTKCGHLLATTPATHLFAELNYHFTTNRPMKKVFGFMSICLVMWSCSTSAPKKASIEIKELTIESIHQSYRNQEYTSEQLVRAYLAEIEELNLSVNAITYVNPEAIAEAKKLDDEFEKKGELKPLHGIPIIVKDNINVVGIPTTAGSLALRNFYPTDDAFIIHKLKEAGAIILAKSNMAEWAFSPMHTESSTHGTTRNPYNTAYVPAGSSGGTAASIAANMGVVGLGTDTGNSIRGPSSHNALVGFRTTLGLISRSGIVPLFLRNDVVGPMCRTVEDATKVMEVMVGYDSTDNISQYSVGKTQSNYKQYLVKNGLQGARIGVLRELISESTDTEVKTLFNNALTDLRALGAEIIDPVKIPDFDKLRKDQWCGTFKKDVEVFLRDFVKSDTVKTVDDIIRIGISSAFAQSGLAEYASTSGGREEAQSDCLDAYTDAKRIAFRTAIRSVMDSLKLDAIIYPSWNNRPAKIAQFEEEYKGYNSQIISPHTGQPAFTVPMGFLSNNLPAGLQFLGRMYDERTFIKLAYAYEQGTKHRKPPELKPTTH
jgi:Asp-tRNA(Asn)/Glu-tRNA(Gln) amidotransferase A subunit family amidase